MGKGELMNRGEGTDDPIEPGEDEGEGGEWLLPTE